MSAEKLTKLRQGQSITSEFLNQLISTVNSLIDDHDNANLNKRTTEEALAKFAATLSTLSEDYKNKLSLIPNFTELVHDYLSVTNNTYSFTDEINEADSPVMKQKNLNIILTSDISPYYAGTKTIYERTIILEMGHTTAESGASVPVNRLWFYYNGVYYNFSTDNNGHTVIGSLPQITIDDVTGCWKIGDTLTTVSAVGPQGLTGQRGPEGAQGPKGDKGDRGLTGAQGITGNNGKTPVVKICSSTDEIGSNVTLDKFVPGTKYIGLKFVYAEDSQSIINQTPWNFIKVLGDTFYPHLSSDGETLYFSTTPPSNSQTQGYRVKGEKGDKGDQGPAPVIIFTDASQTRIEGTSADGGRTQVFDSTLFKGQKGDKGDVGAQGPRGNQGDVGPCPIFREDLCRVEYDDSLTKPKFIMKNYAGEILDNGASANYVGLEIYLPKPKDGSSITIGSVESLDPSNLYQYGAIRVPLISQVNGQPTTTNIDIPVSRPGSSPTIGPDGHWYIDSKDTGVVARGEKGDKGEDGTSVNIKSVAYLPSGTNPVVGSAYKIYSDSGTSNAIIPQAVGEGYLIDGKLFVSSTTGTADNAFIYVGNIQGPQGPAGANGARGSQIFSGSGDPTGISQVQANDIYIDTTGYKIYQFSSSGTLASATKTIIVQNFKGSTGATGPQGKGISSVSRYAAGDTTSNGKCYRITFTDSTTFDFFAKDGISPTAISASLVTNGSTPYCLRITYSDGTQVTTTDSIKGDDGVSVSSISKTSVDGLVDTYTITYSNGTTSTFNVTNGQTGRGIAGVQRKEASDTVQAGKAYEISYTDGSTPFVYFVKDGTDGADGEDGADGADGKSVYFIQNTRANLKGTVSASHKMGDLIITSDYYILTVDGNGKYADASGASFRGERGAHIYTYSGSSSPTSSKVSGSEIGDLAINTTTFTIYKKTAASTWTAQGGTFKGDKGATGAQGPQGPKGETGGAAVPSTSSQDRHLVTNYYGNPYWESMYSTTILKPGTVDTGTKIMWANTTSTGKRYDEVTYVRNNYSTYFDDNPYFYITTIRHGNLVEVFIKLDQGLKIDDFWIRFDMESIAHISKVRYASVTTRDYNPSGTNSQFISYETGGQYVYVAPTSNANINKGFYLHVVGTK